jgi:ribosome-associated protein
MMPDNPTLAAIRTAARAAAEKKGFQIVGLEVSALTSYADGLLICSGGSHRQVGAIADEVQRRLRDEGRRPLHVEGERQSEWVLMDYGDIVVHVFTEERRAYYGLESLWSDAVRLEPADLGIGNGAGS